MIGPAARLPRQPVVEGFPNGHRSRGLQQPSPAGCTHLLGSRLTTTGGDVTMRKRGLPLHLFLRTGLIAAALGLMTPGQAAFGDDARAARAAAIRANYSKFEAQIPMRDGVRLFTTIYVPNRLEGGPWPLLMLRTPYSAGPYGADRYRETLGPSRLFEDAGFIFVFQDVRGKYMSEGEFVDMRPILPKKKPADVDESTDTYDTIEWLLANVERNNGKVGLWGVSYPGFYAAAGTVNSHPALEAVSPQAPIADWFIGDDMHHHGAFTLGMAFNFFSGFGKPRPEPTTERPERFDMKNADGYDFFLDVGPLANLNSAEYLNGEIAFWNQATAHPNYDEFWQARNLLPHLRGVGAAVMTVGGWYDMEDLYGPLHIYRSIEERNPKAWNILVMGPWRHGRWNSEDTQVLGDADFGFNAAAWYRDNVDLPFFEHFLKGKAKPSLPEALVYETGADRWRSFDSWPPRQARPKTLYLANEGSLAWTAPATAPAQSVQADSYVSDPAKPVPYTREINVGWNPNYMTEDQRLFGRRPDVLVYQTEVLEADLTLAGPILADLWVSTTGQDADWVVKLIDVFPPEHPDAESGREPSEIAWKGNMQQLVRGEIFRGRFRESYEVPKPFEPGVPTKVAVPLQDVFHTFKRGHRIMVQVQSTWFPLFDRNPQSWVDNIFEAKAEDFIKATHTVHRSAEHPSRIEVRVLEAP